MKSQMVISFKIGYLSLSKFVVVVMIDFNMDLDCEKLGEGTKENTRINYRVSYANYESIL